MLKTGKFSEAKQLAAVILSAFLNAFVVKVFVTRASLVSSGITGLSLIIQKEALNIFSLNLNYSILYLFINIFILLFVYRSLGKKFVRFSIIHVIMTSIFVEIIPSMHITNDVLLLSVFGGIINGLGISLVLKAGGSSGGTDFVAVYYSIVKNKPMWNKVLIFNSILLLYNGWRYDWTLSFYSIIYQYISTEMISNFHDRYTLSSLRIITEMPNEVSAEILKVVRHGITKFDGVGVYKGKERSMLYMVVNSFEIKQVITAVKDVDCGAFIEVSSVDKIEGNFRQRPLD